MIWQTALATAVWFAIGYIVVIWIRHLERDVLSLEYGNALEMILWIIWPATLVICVCTCLGRIFARMKG